jgi:small-conductance mechanosensitive channel
MTDPSTSLLSLYTRAADLAPKALFVVGILVVGYLASSLLRRLVRAAATRSGLEALVEGAGISRLLYAIGATRGFASLLGSLAFAAGMLATLSAASDALGLTVVSALTGLALRYGPRLLSAVALLIGTVVLAGFVQGLVRHFASQRSDIRSPEGAGRLAYGFIVAVGVMLSAEQAGLEIHFLTTLLELLVAAFGIAFALTFALGFHGVFRAMAAGHYYRPIVRVGDHIRVGENSGTVVRFAPTALILSTEEGERIIPNTLLLEQTIEVVTRRPSRDSQSPDR